MDTVYSQELGARSDDFHVRPIFTPLIREVTTQAPSGPSIQAFCINPVQ